MVLEQEVALLLQHRLDRPGEHPQHAREQNPQSDPAFLDVDGGGNRVSERAHVEVELVSGPARLDLGPARDVAFELVDVVGDAAPRLVLAEAVGEIDVDGL